MASAQRSPLCFGATGLRVNVNDDAFLNAFLRENFRDRPEHLDEWRSLIFNDKDAKRHLLNTVRKLSALDQPFLPERSLILNALTYRPPTEIKAMIVGLDPIPSKDLASGLAFSFPKRSPIDSARKRMLYYNMDSFLLGERDWCTGRAVVEMKKALRKAGIEPLDDFNYCYKHWAQRGVLLLNAALTISEGKNSFDFHNRHGFWLPFTKRLILLILKKSTHTPVLGMFWGSFAKRILDAIRRKIHGDYVILCESYDHPTKGRAGVVSNYFPNASRQFQTKRKLFAPPRNHDKDVSIHDPCCPSGDERPLAPEDLFDQDLENESPLTPLDEEFYDLDLYEYDPYENESPRTLSTEEIIIIDDDDDDQDDNDPEERSLPIFHDEDLYDKDISDCDLYENESPHVPKMTSRSNNSRHQRLRRSSHPAGFVSLGKNLLSFFLPMFICAWLGFLIYTGGESVTFPQYVHKYH